MNDAASRMRPLGTQYVDNNAETGVTTVNGHPVDAGYDGDFGQSANGGAALQRPPAAAIAQQMAAPMQGQPQMVSWVDENGNPMQVSPQQRQKLQQLAALNLPADQYQANKQNILGFTAKPMAAQPYTLQNADGTTTTVNLTPEQYVQASLSGARLGVAKENADTGAARQKDNADYHTNLLDQGQQKLDALKKEMDSRANNEAQRTAGQMLSAQEKQEQKQAELFMRVAKTKLDTYVQSHPNLQPNDPGYNQLVQEYVRSQYNQEAIVEGQISRRQALATGAKGQPQGTPAATQPAAGSPAPAAPAGTSSAPNSAPPPLEDRIAKIPTANMAEGATGQDKWGQSYVFRGGQWVAQ